MYDISQKQHFIYPKIQTKIAARFWQLLFLSYQFGWAGQSFVKRRGQQLLHKVEQGKCFGSWHAALMLWLKLSFWLQPVQNH